MTGNLSKLQGVTFRYDDLTEAQKSDFLQAALPEIKEAVKEAKNVRDEVTDESSELKKGEREREKSEEERRTEENKRETEEEKRVAAEEIRQSAEEIRENSEEIRKTAERARTAAEELREEAEVQRNKNAAAAVERLQNIDAYAQTAEEARASFDEKDDGSGYDLVIGVPQGEKGERGNTGAQGYTPKRGTDYWTEGDKAEIVADTAKSLDASFTQTLSDATDYTDNVFAASIKSVTYNPDSAVFTFTKGDNTDIVIDLPIEATVKNGYYDDAQKELVLVLVNDLEIRIPASGLIADYDGCATGTIRCSVSADNIISCNIVSGSITKTLLTTELQEEINAKANRQTTLAGYGIADAYTKAEVDAKTAYASEAQRGTVRVWTTYDGDEVVLNISTEDADDEA